MFWKNSKVRLELQSVYNFIFFLLFCYFKDVGKFIYLDVDIVVKVCNLFFNFFVDLFLVVLKFVRRYELF